MKAPKNAKQCTVSPVEPLQRDALCKAPVGETKLVVGDDVVRMRKSIANPLVEERFNGRSNVSATSIGGESPDSSVLHRCAWRNPENFPFLGRQRSAKGSTVCDFLLMQRNRLAMIS